MNHLQDTEAISKRIAELPPERRAVLERLLKDEGVSAPPLSTLPPRRDTDVVPLSFTQQRLWFLDQLEPGNPAYNMTLNLRLTGPLQVAALERSLGEVIRRHEVLRTTFPIVDGQVVQKIWPAPTFTLPVLDLQEYPPGEQESQVQRLAQAEAQRSFDLTNSPLLRATLLRLSEQQHVLLLTMHHIITDGWSLGVLVQELSTLYDAYSQGQPSPLPPLPLQYADFALWQRQWMQGEVLEAELNYWKQQLAGAPPVLNLPTDRPRPPVQTFRGAHYPVALSKALTEALKRLGRECEVTLFMTLLAAFATLLHRYAGQDDIVIGTPIAGRTRVELEGLIGYFANTLVLRLNLAHDPSFRELLARVRQVTLSAYAHQDLPFERLVDALQLKRDLSYNPVFQVLFGLHNAPRRPLELTGLTWSPLEVESGTARFDLVLDLCEDSDGVRGVFEYNTDLFEAATIARLAGHFQTLLEGVVADPDRRLSRLPLLTESERRQLLLEWNDTESVWAYSRRQDASSSLPLPTLPHVFEAQVQREPQAVALVCEGQRLTYQELNQRANQLAHYLQKFGVGPEVLVGICVERSVDMLVGLLGILKAGGAYVPLDPEYPQERLAFMLEDTQAPVLLTQRHLLERLPRSSARVICLDTDWEVIAQESVQNPLLQVTGDNLAYVIYTSGSTGRPKGIAVSHQSVVHLIDVTQPLLSFNEHDVWTVVHSYAFDFSVWEMMGPLLTGGRLVIVPLPVAQSPAALYELLCRERVTILNQTPSAIRQLIDAKEAAGSGRQWAVRLIIVGGEAFPRELAPRLLEWGVPVWNFYGPTEATVWAAINPVSSVDSGQATIPIGRPLPHTQLYVLDAHGQPVPVSVSGELYIGGVGLARGYFNRPELTAEMFLPQPFGSQAGARLYRTGDAARYRPDGSIEFLGRLDDQVKIRGFRIELGEIEAALAQHPSVREAVSVVREDVPGQKRLVAYLVPRQEQSPTVSDLRHFLLQKLPDYMVPQAYVFMETLPLSPNGKVDRRALPMPSETRPELESELVVPRTDLEQFLTGLWKQALRLKKIGVHDDFFELGGDSITAALLVNKLQEALGEFVHVGALFAAPTIAQLADYLTKQYPQATARAVEAYKATAALGEPSRKAWLPRRFISDLTTGLVSKVKGKRVD